MSAIDSQWPPVPDLPRRLSAAVTHLLAPNANFMTYEGTNTWIVGADGDDVCLVIDPGSREPAHLDAITSFAHARRWRVGQILLTHSHPDHSEGARELAGETNAPIRGFDAAVVDEVLTDGEVFDVGDQPLTAIRTPGHSDDSAVFWLPRVGSVFTGDTIVGGTHSAGVFGSLRQYFASLDRLRVLAVGRPGTRFLPGHGPVVSDPVVTIDQVRRLREHRLAQVRAVIADGVFPDGAFGADSDADRAAGIEVVVDALYPHLHGIARFPARSTVAGYLNYLESEAVIEGEG